MVTLPKNFTATKYDGYFWDVENQKLFSIKVAGTLRPVKLNQPNRFNKQHSPHYRVSVNGERKMLHLPYLKSLVIEDSEIPKSGS